jgi:hypothetical protein
MKINATSLLNLSVIAVSTLFFSTSCKKSSSTPSSGLSVSINGTAFTPALVSAFDFQGYLQVTGYKIAGTDSSAVYLQFNDTTSLNKPTDIGYNSNNAEVVWTDKSTIYDSWNSYSHGTMTVTSYDKTNKKVSGTFSGVFYASSGTDSVKVTGGTFNSAYLTP